MKNRITRSVVVVVLVLAMLLAVAGCESAPVPSTPAPSVTPTPSETPAPEASETPAPQPSETPAPQADEDEETLNEYGISFPTFDNLVFGEKTSFGFDIDTLNKYINAYEVSIKATISGVDHSGKSISSSKLTVDGNKTLTWENDGQISPEADHIAELRFEALGAGVYTVKYEIQVEHDKSKSYGFYTPGEVDEEFEIVKTYTVEKAELEIKTDSDAFRVEDKIFFAPTTVVGGTTLKDLSSGDFTTSVNITVCDGTVVGAFPLAITLLDKDGDAVDADDITLQNYFVTVSEGTRYILSAEDVAKVNAIRTMVALDNKAQYTTEYSIETISYYNTLTDAQKQMASVDFQADNKYYNGVIVASKAVSSADIEKAVYNMERDGLIKPIEDAIDAYMTASTTTKKQSALKSLAEMLLNIDNTAHKYGSDLLYVLGALSADFDIDDLQGGEVFTVVAEGAKNDIDIVTFQTAYDADDKVFSATFGYLLESNTSVVNEIYDEYLTDYFEALDEFEKTSSVLLESDKISQTAVTEFVKDVEQLEKTYDALIPFQVELAFAFDVETEIQDGHKYCIRVSNMIISRWDAYIQLIDMYGFDESYINNAGKDKLGATYMMMYSILGYSFDNSNLTSEKIQVTGEDILGINGSALSNILFLNSKIASGVPELFVDGLIAEIENKIAMTLTVQAEIDALRTDLIQYLVSTGEYEKVYASDATGKFETLMDALLGEDLDAAYTAAAAISLKDVDGELECATLADIYAYIDGVIASELLNPGSSFNKDLKKDGLEEALSELFEDIAKEAKSAIKELAETDVD